MNCRDFEPTWNRLLDAESGARRDDGPEATTARLDLETRLREHAGECSACRRRQERFETLQAAMRIWSARSAPEPVIADRIIKAADEPEVLSTPRRLGRGAGAVAMTIAAAVLLAVLLRTDESPRPTEIPRPVSLSVAVADARDASWRLARTASEPAARLVLDASFSDVEVAAEAEPKPPSTFEEPPALLDQVGGYAAAGARPLSDAARQAFGFLRSPAPAPPDHDVPAPDAPKGA